MNDETITNNENPNTAITTPTNVPVSRHRSGPNAGAPKTKAHIRKAATTAKKLIRKADRPKADRSKVTTRTNKTRSGAPQIPWNKGKKTGIKPWNAGKKLPYKVWNAGKKTGIKPWNKGKKIAQSTKPNTTKKTTTKKSAKAK